jgi:hypothetical protein
VTGHPSPSTECRYALTKCGGRDVTPHREKSGRKCMSDLTQERSPKLFERILECQITSKNTPLPSEPLTPTVAGIHGDVNKKGKIDEVFN